MLIGAKGCAARRKWTDGMLNAEIPPREFEPAGSLKAAGPLSKPPGINRKRVLREFYGAATVVQ